MKQPKRHIYLDNYEWRIAVNGLNEFRNQRIREGRAHNPVDEVLLKFIDYLHREGARGVDFLGGTNAGEYDQQFVGLTVQQAQEMVTAHCIGKLAGQEELTARYLANDPGRSAFTAWKDLKNDLYLRMGAVSYAAVFAECGRSAWLYYLQDPETGGRGAAPLSPCRGDPGAVP